MADLKLASPDESNKSLLMSVTPNLPMDKSGFAHFHLEGLLGGATLIGENQEIPL